MATDNFTSGGFLYLYFCVFIAFLNSAINGFDNSLMSGVIVMDGFKGDFGDLSAAANPSINGLLFCLLQLGAITAFPFVGPVSDKWGRLWGMRVGSILIIAGAILEIATKVLGVFCVGRYMIGSGVCFVVSSAPTYVVEIAHPVFRGRATAVYNSGWHVGAIPAAVIIYALQQSGAKETSSWQIPCGIQGVWSVVVLAGTFFMPESPRYLVSVGKLEAARDFMVKYHASGDASHPIIEEQMQEIEQAIQAEKAQKSDTYAALFATRANRLRVGIMVGVGFFSQTAGNWIASYFQSQVVAYFGFTTVEQALMLNIVTGCISLVASFGGSSLVDKFGRRPYLVYGTASYIFFFAVLTLLVGIYNQGEIQETAQGPIAAGIAGFVFLQLFGISYSICWTSINALYPVEVLSYSTRAKGMALCQAMVNVANIVQSWVLSYGLNAYKWKFFSFYVVFNTFALVVIYFYFPETKGRTLEEIDEIFQAPNPVKKSLEKPERTLEDFVKGSRGEKVATKA